MSITDFVTNEVRIRHETEFTQSPNFVIAGEELADGQFVTLSTSDGNYMLADQDTRATHLVLKSGEARKTAAEITNNLGKVLVDEPVMAVTGGPGIVTIPFAANVIAGQDLTLDATGYAIPWDSDTGATGAFIVGKALETVTGTSTADRWGDAFLNLPAQHSPAPTA